MSSPLVFLLFNSFLPGSDVSSCCLHTWFLYVGEATEKWKNESEKQFIDTKWNKGIGTE